MCLITYVPAGKAMAEAHFRMAAEDNADGIGIMSATDGVAKFLGRKATKRALRYARRLTSRGVQHAIHFRYATHGTVDRANCHPHRMPDGGWLMHNGVMAQYAGPHGDRRSDTAIFCTTLDDVPAQGGPERSAYWEKIGRHIGAGNKLVVLHTDGRFEIVNATSGDWIDGVWYSQTYSINPVKNDWRAWNDPDRDEEFPVIIADSYTDALRRALERRYGFPIEPSDVHSGLLEEEEEAIEVAHDGGTMRYSDWKAARRDGATRLRDGAAPDDYAEYMNEVGMA